MHEWSYSKIALPLSTLVERVLKVRAELREPAWKRSTNGEALSKWLKLFHSSTSLIYIPVMLSYLPLTPLLRYSLPPSLMEMSLDL